MCRLYTTAMFRMSCPGAGVGMGLMVWQDIHFQSSLPVTRRVQALSQSWLRLLIWVLRSRPPLVSLKPVKPSSNGVAGMAVEPMVWARCLRLQTGN
jgi:hypothetical protein